MAKYLWQEEKWPEMHWDDSKLSKHLAEAHILQGQLLGKAAMFGTKDKNEAILNSMTEEVLHSSEIEGLLLNRDSVRSSLANHLGIETAGLKYPDHYSEGVVQVMMDATQNYTQKITAERLFAWHSALFPTGYSGMYKITVGQWRHGEEAMQIVSGAMGKQKVHYEAPPSSSVPAMMTEFLEWIENKQTETDPLIIAAIAHLRFVTIHPFDDGNGRICRTITECLLSRADNTPQRFYSLSAELMKHRKDYYNNLEAAQQSNLDVTQWIEWFICTLKDAIRAALDKTERVFEKTRFWDKYRELPLNERQAKVINMLLDGFDGKLTSSKWYKINHCSQDTALRDINDLISKGVLQKSPDGGRNSSYELIMP